MKHLRVYVNLGFWKPCVRSKDLTDDQIAAIEALDAALTAALPIIGQVLILQVTDLPAGSTVPTTLPSDVHTLD